ncbi:MAG: MATE family efflux transporter [Prevotella sp.]|nr:MATE family efflux transporter [Prevotella sp.]
MSDNKKAALELGTKPVGKLLMQYAIPAIIAMTASSLYNMVDSIFIGQGVGPLAISGLAITFPLMNLSAAFGAAVGVGASTFISVKLGQKDYDTAKHILGNTMTLNLIMGLGVGLVCLLFLDPILRFFGASDQTIPYARDYMVIILLGNVITHMYFGLNAVLRAAGKPKHAMSATIFTVVLNTLLDPLFIYTFGLGIKGAAYATVLAQSLALIWQLYTFSRPKELLHFKRGTFRLQSSIIRNIIAIGLSPFSMNVCACIVVILINNSMVHYGSDLAVGAYGIANKVAFIFVMINMGVNQGMQPIAGYNYGAMRYDRLMKVVKYSIIAATAIMTTGFIIAMTIPGTCARLFTTDPTLIDLSAKGIRYIMVAFPVVGYQMVVSNFFQSIGKAKISIVLSLSRQLLILLPLLLVLPTMFGINGVWVSMPVSDTLSAFMAAWIMIVYMRKFKKQHNEITNEQKVIDNEQKQLTNKQKDTNQ